MHPPWWSINPPFPYVAQAPNRCSFAIYAKSLPIHLPGRLTPSKTLESIKTSDNKATVWIADRISRSRLELPKRTTFLLRSPCAAHVHTV